MAEVEVDVVVAVVAAWGALRLLLQLLW